MNERIDAELALIQQRFPDAEYREEGCWFRVPSYPLPDGWNRTETDVAFQVAQGYTQGNLLTDSAFPPVSCSKVTNRSNYTEPSCQPASLWGGMGTVLLGA